MTAIHPRRTAAAVAGAALVGLVAAGANPATAAPSAASPAVTASAVTARAVTAQRAVTTAHGSRTSSVRRALATSAGVFPTVAVIRGSNRVVYATTGSGFVNLGGQVIDDPAVAAGPNQLWFLGKGTDSHLYIRSADTGWRLASNSPVIGTSLTAAWIPGPPPNLYATFLTAQSSPLDGRSSAVEAVVVAVSFPASVAAKGLVEDAPVYGLATNVSTLPMMIGPDYPIGLHGATGNLLKSMDPAGTTTEPMDMLCARDRFATASSATYPTAGAVVCRSADAAGSINFLGMAGAHNLGGHIIGSPGIALRVNHDSDSVVYVTGTNHKVYSTTVTDGTTAGGPGDFHSTPFLNLGGYATGGVQAVSFSLDPVDK